MTRSTQGGAKLTHAVAEFTDEELEALPVFPLPELVLLPGTRLSLHLFEPRYREMITDCVRQDRMVMAVAQLKPGWDRDYHGAPEFHDTAGAARISEHQQNPDGTHDIELSACARVKLTELPQEHRSYRIARGFVLSERSPGGQVNTAELTGLMSIATQMATLIRRADPSFTLRAQPTDNPGTMADLIADQLLPDPATRQDVLETLDVTLRLRTVTSRVGQLLAALQRRQGNALH